MHFSCPLVVELLLEMCCLCYSPRNLLSALETGAAVERTWHMRDSQGQILAMACKSKSLIYLDFGFWGLAFGLWVFGFGSWVLGCRLRVLGFGFWVLGLGFGF